MVLVSFPFRAAATADLRLPLLEPAIDVEITASTAVVRRLLLSRVSAISDTEAGGGALAMLEAKLLGAHEEVRERNRGVWAARFAVVDADAVRRLGSGSCWAQLQRLNVLPAVQCAASALQEGPARSRGRAAWMVAFRAHEAAKWSDGGAPLKDLPAYFVDEQALRFSAGLGAEVRSGSTQEGCVRHAEHVAHSNPICVFIRLCCHC